jgi:hypothetical protein
VLTLLRILGGVLVLSLIAPAARAQGSHDVPRPAPPTATSPAPTAAAPGESEWERQGRELRRQRRVRDAIALYEAACRPTPIPRCVWLQIESWDELREPIRAAELFPLYDRIRRGTPPTYDEVKTRVMGSVAQLRVVPEGPVPTGVTFRLDGVALRGEQIGGEIVFVHPGEHVIDVRGDGRESVQRTVRLTAGESVHAVSLPIPAERVSIAGRWWFWTIVGVAVAGGVTAAVLLSTQEAPSSERTRPPSPLLGTGFQVIRSVP